MRRIRDIRIHVNIIQPWHGDIYSLLHQPAPRAENISLNLVGKGNRLRFPLPATTPGLLKSVDLISINLHSQLYHISGLSNISIKSCDISLSELIAVLEASPKLASLTLAYCHIDDSIFPRLVYLPCLSELTLYLEHTRTGFGLLRATEMPNLLRWTMRSYDVLGVDSLSDLSLFSNLMRRVYSFEKIKIRAFSFKSKTTVEILQNDYLSPKFGAVYLRLGFSQVDLNTIMAHLIPAFQRLLERAKYLDLVIPSKLLTIKTWQMLYYSTINVVAVRAEAGSSLYHGINYLLALGYPSEQASFTATEIPCQKLDCIGIAFINRNFNYDETITALNDLLRLRSHYGYAIRKVRLTCKFRPVDEDRNEISSRWLQWIQELEWNIE